MRRLLRAMVIPTAAIAIATLFAPADPGVEASEAVVREAQVYPPTPNPNTPPVDWLHQSVDLIAQLAPSD